VLDIIIKVVEAICILLLASLTIVTFAQAFNRYVLNGSFFWAEEFAIMAMIYITFLGSVLAVRYGKHTRIDFLLLSIKPRIRKYVEALDYIIMSVFLVILAKNALPIIDVTKSQLTLGMKVPRATYYYAILISSILMVIYLIVLAICKLVNHDIDGGSKA